MSHDNFNNELENLRVLAPKFARAYPALAPHLAGSSTDPDVERLLEAMGYQIALLRRKMVCDFPELVHQMASLILPHYLRQYPATTVIGFTPDPPMRESAVVPKGAQFNSVPVEGTPCTFSTNADVEIHPLQLTGAAFVQQSEGAGEIRLSLVLRGLPLSRWQPRMPLRLYLSDDFGSASELYLLLNRYVTRIVLTPAEGGDACVLPTHCLSPAGFTETAVLLPYPSHVFPGYRLLQEYFNTPEKFLFFDLSGWEQWQARGEGMEFTIGFELASLPSRPPRIRRESFTLHAVIAVNLFPHDADPISVNHRTGRYPVRPHGSNPAHYHIFSIDRVTGYSRSTGRARDFVPLEQFDSDDITDPFYHLIQSKRQSDHEVYLAVSYPGEMPAPNSESLSISISCTNASLADNLRIGDVDQPLCALPDFVTARNITQINAGQAPPLGPGLLRKLVTHLSLNHQSLQSVEKLRTLLELYIFPDQSWGDRGAANLKRIAGIEALEVIAVEEMVAGIFMKGREVRMRVNQDNFAGVGDMFLFGCVLDHFLAGYASTNTYTRLICYETSRGESYRWPIRLGKCDEAGLVFKLGPSGSKCETIRRNRNSCRTEMNSASLIDELLAHGPEFSFDQVMRIARSTFGPGGKEHIPDVSWQDRVRIRSELSLTFPAADVSLVERIGTDLLFKTTFLKLLDCLPVFYSEDLMDEATADLTATIDFLGIFQQRLYLLFFECASKSTFLNRLVEVKCPANLERLFSLIGLGEKELRDGVPDAHRLMRHAPLLTLANRSALGLQTLLRSELGINCLEVEQCVLRRVSIPNDQRMHLGGSCCTLGVNAVVGSELQDRKGKIRIHIGPLKMEIYNGFLPGTPRHALLIRLIRLYLADPLECDLNLILAAGEAKPLSLGDPNMGLGFNAWCFTGDTIGEVSTILQLFTWPVEPPPLSNEHQSQGTQAPALIDLFQQEMVKLRDLAARFAEDHPKVASLVRGDPSVERLFEGAAFMFAKLRLKLDDDYPEIIHDVIDAIQPNSLKQIPATTTVVFSPKPNCKGARTIPLGTELKSVPLGGTACCFTTRYPVEIHPLSLIDVTFTHPPGKSALITLNLKLTEIPLDDWNLKSLRLFLAGERVHALNLYLVFLRYLRRIVITPGQGGQSVTLDATHLKAVGFEEMDVLFPSASLGSASSTASYQMMQEYFIQPDKFLFLDLWGWEKWQVRGEATLFEISFELAKLPFVLHQVSMADFALFATPAVNVFMHQAEPIIPQNIAKEYPIIPVGNQPEQYEIFSVEKVAADLSVTVERILFTPRSHNSQKEQQRLEYHVTRKISNLGRGFDTYISLSLPQQLDPQRISELSVILLCTNGKVPETLGVGDICIPCDSTPSCVTFENCKPVAAATPPVFGHNRLWRLFSLSSTNLGTVTSSSLRAMLGLICSSVTQDGNLTRNQKQVSGITDLKIQATDRLFRGSMLRGWEIRIKLDQDCYECPGELYLFGALLDHFLGGFATQSCFTRTMVEDDKGGREYEWPARMRRRALL